MLISKQTWRLLGAVVVIGVVAYFMTQPGPSPVKSHPLTSVPSKASKVVLFTKQDYEVAPASFANLPPTMKDAFEPVIKKTVGIGGPGGAGGPAGIPALLAEGDANWIYTGSATVNGRPQALLENKSTGEGEYVTVGERWKQARVEAITSDRIILVGPDGDKSTIMLEGTEPQNFAPAKVNGSALSGSIGGLTVTPDTSQRAGGRTANGGNNGTQ